MSDLVKIGAIWEKTDKNGNPIMTGKIFADLRIMICPNNKKTSDNQPDWEIFQIIDNGQETRAITSGNKSPSGPKITPKQTEFEDL